MALNTAQRTTLAAALRADTDPTVAAAVAARNDTLTTSLYNENSTFIVWRSRRSRADLRTDALAGAAEMDNLEAGKRDALFWMLADDIDPSNAAVRQAFVDLTANRTGGFVATALRAALAAGGKRAATIAEKLFATGTGTNGTPGLLGFEGQITSEDVGRALNDNA